MFTRSSVVAGRTRTSEGVAGSPAVALVRAITTGEAGAEPLQHEFVVVVREHEAALAAAELALGLQHGGAHVGRAVDHDGARLGVAVARVQAVQADRAAVLADVLLARAVGALGAGVGAHFVGKALQPPTVLRIGPAAMGHQQGVDDLAAPGSTR